MISTLCANRLSVFVIAAASLLLAGCPGGTGQPSAYPVTGIVKYKGNPVEGARVAFISDKAPRAAEGVTDSSGRFKLSTFGIEDGAVEGEHKVTVTKVEGGAAKPEDTSGAVPDPANLAQKAQTSDPNAKISGPKHLLPEKYSNPSTTDLKKTVSATTANEILIELTD